MISSFYCTACGRGLESWECSGHIRSFSLERLYCPDCHAPVRTSGPWLLFVGCGILLGSFLEIPGDAFPFPIFLVLAAPFLWFGIWRTRGQRLARKRAARACRENRTAGDT